MTVRDENLRRRLWQALEPRARKRGLSPLNTILAVLIVASVSLAIVATEPAVLRRFGVQLAAAELALGLIFAVEYVARIWIAAEGQSSSLSARLRFLCSPIGLADLLAVA